MHDCCTCPSVGHIARLGKWTPPPFQHWWSHQKAKVFLISQNWATSPCFVLVCSCFTGAVQVLALGVQANVTRLGAIYIQMLCSHVPIATLKGHQLNQKLPPQYFVQTPIIPGQQGSGFPLIQVHYSKMKPVCLTHRCYAGFNLCNCNNTPTASTNAIYTTPAMHKLMPNQ